MTKFFHSILFLTLSLPVVLLPYSSVHARWATEDDADVECMSQKVLYTVKEDGSWQCKTNTYLKVLTEAGRMALSTQCFEYDATRETFKVLKATTKNSGLKFTVSEERIEDKPLASDSLGLSKKHQILVPFEQIVVGSTLHLITERHHIRPDIEKHFSLDLAFNDGHWRKTTEIIIESELPLFSKINDPRDCLKVGETRDSSKHTWRIKLKKPIFEHLVSEPENSYGDPSTFTSLSFSTEEDYQRIGKLEAALYQPTITAPLPKDLDKIRRVASEIKDEKVCIDTIVASLIDKITYLGSWDTAEGHFAPRSLEAIIRSGQGDCKEYASCLAAILNQLGKGYKARIACIYRGQGYLETVDSLPSTGNFNHAIVKVITPSGKTYWIDPTNIVTMAGGIFPDIADRPVEILDPENPTYERTPPIDYRHSIEKIDRTISIMGDGHVNVEGSRYVEGESAINFTEALNQYAHSQIKEAFLRNVFRSTNPINPIVNLPTLPKISRQVSPLTTTFSYKEKDVLTRTNLGYAYFLTGNLYSSYVSSSEDNEGALYVGEPATIIVKQVFKNVSAKNLESLAFSIQTPWVNAKRELSEGEDGIVVIETFEKLKSIISAKDLKSRKFRKLQKDLRKYGDGVAIVFSR
ncbi:MAG: DUF3857 and transglutaminase domain-containing protein [Alphaproteobacteria bacterium]|nr:DUF3857 and transglutaminase domain-containing protein [Alphaproteobacteria bacterium]